MGDSGGESGRLTCAWLCASSSGGDALLDCPAELCRVVLGDCELLSSVQPSSCSSLPTEKLASPSFGAL